MILHIAKSFQAHFAKKAEQEEKEKGEEKE